MMNAIFSSLLTFISYLADTMKTDKVSIEVKWFKGRFIPYGKPVTPDATAFENAIAYIANPKHAAFYALPFITRGGKGRKGNVRIAIYARETLLKAIKAFETSGQFGYGALGLHNGAVAFMRAEEQTMRQTFGKPVLLLDTSLTKKQDLQPDASRPNAPYACAWEKICAKGLQGTWTGSLRNVQVDVVVNLSDD